jgi:hypothetical protein
MVELYLHFPTRIYGVVLNKLSTGTSSPSLNYVVKHYAMKAYGEVEICQAAAFF